MCENFLLVKFLSPIIIQCMCLVVFTHTRAGVMWEAWNFLHRFTYVFVKAVFCHSANTAVIIFWLKYFVCACRLSTLWVIDSSFFIIITYLYGHRKWLHFYRKNFAFSSIFYNIIHRILSKRLHKKRVWCEFW